MANIAYIRVSTAEQNEARQVEAMKQYKIDKTFTEKVSGKSKNRPELQKMLEYAREGDTIHIHDFSRLARNTRDLLSIVEDLNARGITLISNKENIDTSTPTGKLMLTMIGAIAEFERTNLLERQREGIAVQKELDKKRKPEDRKYKGRKPAEVQDFAEYYDRYMRREITKAQMARDLKVSRPTLDKIIKEYKEDLQKGYKSVFVGPEY